MNITGIWFFNLIAGIINMVLWVDDNDIIFGIVVGFTIFSLITFCVILLFPEKEKKK